MEKEENQGETHWGGEEDTNKMTEWEVEWDQSLPEPLTYLQVNVWIELLQLVSNKVSLDPGQLQKLTND